MPIFSELSPWNLNLFSMMNAPDTISPLMLFIGTFFAKYVIFLLLIAIAIGWLRGNSAQRGTILFAACAALLGLIISFIIGHLWYTPRPFVAGIGHTYLNHAPDSAFPSDHMTAMWALGWAFVMRGNLRGFGFVTLILALLVGWARVYVGVHYPLDIIGGLLLGIFAVSVMSFFQTFLDQKILPLLENLYRKLFSGLIKLGWAKA